MKIKFEAVTVEMLGAEGGSCGTGSKDVIPMALIEFARGRYGELVFADTKGGKVRVSRTLDGLSFVLEVVEGVEQFKDDQSEGGNLGGCPTSPPRKPGEGEDDRAGEG